MDVDRVKASTRNDRIGTLTLMSIPPVVDNFYPYISDSSDPESETAAPAAMLRLAYGNSNNCAASSTESMREMIFRIAMMQPIQIDPESVKPPKRKNVKISKDPQSVAARHRRERISERIRILQRMVPGGTKMDTASMLDEAAHYLKFLKKQVHSLEQAQAATININHAPITFIKSSPPHMHMQMQMQMLS